MIAVGEITQAIPSRRAYFVSIYGGTEQLCRVGNTGHDIPLTEGDQVLCLKSDTGASSGWVIAFRLDSRKEHDKNSEALEKSAGQIRAEQQEDLIGKAVGGCEREGLPDWSDGDWGVKGGIDPPVYGETLSRSRTSGSYHQITSNGSIISFADEILHFILSKHNKAAILRMKHLILDVIPGFFLNVLPVETRQLPSVPSKAERVRKTRTRIEGGIASDPETNVLDFFLEAGSLFDMDDPMCGKSTDTTEKRIKRGLRFRIGDFAILETDLDNKEIRLTMESETPEDLYQIRLNANEFVVSWGKQFMAFRSDGITLKGDLLGFAGPWAMWSKAVTETLFHNTELSEDQMKPLCEWNESGSGIKFNKSVYFGDKAEPAVLQSFIDDVYKVDMEVLKTHFHSYAPPAVVTGPSPALQVGLELTGMQLEPPLLSSHLSDVLDL